MAFWGVVLRPGTHYIHKYDKTRGRLRVVRATLGWGGSTKKTVLQCNIGGKSPILLCTLLPEKMESCSLNIEYEEDEEVTFSSIGPRSVHLSGFYLLAHPQVTYNEDKSETYGEDIGQSDSERSSESIADGEDNDFIDDGEPEVFPSLSGDKDISSEPSPAKSKKRRRLKKKNHTPEFVGRSSLSSQHIMNHSNIILETEDDEVNLPLLAVANKGSTVIGTENCDKIYADDDLDERRVEVKCDENQSSHLKRKSTHIEQYAEEHSVPEVMVGNRENEEKANMTTKQNDNFHGRMDHEQAASNITSHEFKRSKKHGTSGSGTSGMQQRIALPLKAELLSEILHMGEPDGKVVSQGDKVVIFYTGKIKENEQIFCSNIGKKPHKFRLGRGHVVQGLEVGIIGMRVGEKRRFNIPPSMGYGEQGTEEVPANSWIQYDVELVDIRHRH